MAEYPGSLPTFDTKTDYVTVIFADHVNKLQTELLAAQTTLGASVLTSSGWNGVFSTSASTHASVKARLDNIEYGLNTAYNGRVATAGGSTVTSSATTVVGLKFVPVSSQSVNQTEWYNGSSAVVTKVDQNGLLYTYNKQVVPVVYASSAPTSIPAGTIWVDSSTDIGTLNFQGVVPDGGAEGEILTKASDDDYDYVWAKSPEVGFNPFLLGGM